MDYFAGHMFGFWGWGNFLFMILFWILIIWLIFYFIKKATEKNGTKNDPRDKAMDILKERYAKGEIGEDEFRNKKKELAEN